jgi:hypothetical protein
MEEAPEACLQHQKPAGSMSRKKANKGERGPYQNEKGEAVQEACSAHTYQHAHFCKQTYQNLTFLKTDIDD